MSGPGVIALDPVRMAGLEQYLQGLGEGFRRRSAQVAAAVAGTGTGVSVAGEAAALDRLAVLCQRQREEVAWRRAQVEQIPDGVPLPAWPRDSAGAAAVDALVARTIAVIDAHPPRPEALADLLPDLARLRGSSALAARYLLGISARRTRDLHALVARSDVASLEPLIGDTVRIASRAPGDGSRTGGALSAGWVATYLGAPSAADTAALDATLDAEGRRVSTEVKDRLSRAGFGLSVASVVGGAVGAGVLKAVLSGASGGVGVVSGTLALADGDGAECDVPEAALGVAGGALAVGGAATGVIPLAVAGVALSILGSVFGECEHQEPRTAEVTPTFNPDTGETRLPSGSLNPHVDAAGVPFASSS